MARYIDVDDLNNNFRGELCNHIHCENCSFHKGSYFCNLAEYLLKYETADVAPVVLAYNKSKDGFLCSACKFGDFGAFEHGGKYTPKYCPNCGARMDGGWSDG